LFDQTVGKLQHAQRFTAHIASCSPRLPPESSSTPHCGHQYPGITKYEHEHRASRSRRWFRSASWIGGECGWLRHEAPAKPEFSINETAVLAANVHR
jgi:hypothetical protein